MGARLRFLDGIRGWAAVTVVIYHFFLDGFPVPAVIAWKTMLLRVFFLNGFFAVILFFVVSGFSLSIVTIRRADRMQPIKLAAGRYFRLAIPIIAICAIVCLLMILGVIMPAAERPALQTFLAFTPTLQHLLTFSLYTVFVDYSHEVSFVPPLWTMAIELTGSFIVLVTILIFRHAPARIAATFVLCAVFAYYGSYYALFLFGVLLAEAHSADISVPLPLSVAVLAVGIALTTLGHVAAYMVGGCCLVAGATFLQPIRAFFETSVSAFLGRISFSLYLVHAPLMYAVTLWLLLYVDRLVACLISIPLVFVAAIAFNPIDRFAVAVARTVGDAVIRLCLYGRPIRA
jgi:peptidoglycan/LPS O-acetylase OafA/YrhL